jgi:hypothetical protein
MSSSSTNSECNDDVGRLDINQLPPQQSEHIDFIDSDIESPLHDESGKDFHTPPNEQLPSDDISSNEPESKGDTFFLVGQTYHSVDAFLLVADEYANSMGFKVSLCCQPI